MFTSNHNGILSGIDLTVEERRAVSSSVRNSIELYERFVELRAEDPRMARKQGQKRKQLVVLKAALKKLKAT